MVEIRTPICRVFGAGVIQLLREKNDTDMAAALREAWQRGYRIFHIYGGRFDHTLADAILRSVYPLGISMVYGVYDEAAKADWPLIETLADGV